MRLPITELYGDALLARRIAVNLARLEGVVAAKANPRTGRVLIHFAAPGAAHDLLAPGVLESVVERSQLDSKPDDIAAPVASQASPTDWHAVHVSELYRTLNTSAEGLTGKEAARRLREQGPNLHTTLRPRSSRQILSAQLRSTSSLLLLGAAGASLIVGDLLDAAIISVVVLTNAAIGFRMESRSEAYLAAWRRWEAGKAQVVRDGVRTTVEADNLVPGDLILVRKGDILPADARVIEAHRLASDEASLTGESEPRAKHAEPVDPRAPLLDRTSMVYRGMPVVAGHGRAIVTATGSQTEQAMVRSLVESTAPVQTPLDHKLAELGRKGTYAGLGAATIAAAVGMLRGAPPGLVIRRAVALAVAAVPEGLPVVANAALVRSMQRMRANDLVVRRLSSAETLGGVTVVCTDKTGTLTRNEMAVEWIETRDGRFPAAALRNVSGQLFTDPLATVLAAGILNSDLDYRYLENGNGIDATGSSTERALAELAERAGLDVLALRERFPRKMLQERSDGVNYVMSLHSSAAGDIAFLKGAPEQVLGLCTEDGACTLTQPRRREILERNEALASQGYRVLAVAWKRLASGTTAALPAPAGYEFAGLVALRDPLREGAADAVQVAGHAGIRTMILTGDQRATAASVARELGLHGQIADGAELVRGLARSNDALSRLAQIAVVSRVTPADKLIIVRALRERGEIVAMVGDGVNDAPALKAADIGIAVGPGASDLARQTADVILEKAELRSILAAVSEGRIVQDNIRRAIRFLFATNMSEVILTLGASVLGYTPLHPLQLLWINLLTDTLPALAIALEPGDPNVLDRRPAPPHAPVLTPAEWHAVIRDGALLGGLGAAAYAAGGPVTSVATLIAGQLAYAFSCRAPDAPLRPRFVRLVGAAAMLQTMALALPPFRRILRLGGPSLLPWAGFTLGFLLPLLPGAVVKGGVKAGRWQSRGSNTTNIFSARSFTA